MKRVTSLLLAMALLVGFALTIAPVAHAASEMTVSDAMVSVLKQEEGFARKPYWDYGQYTVGYGTKCPSDMVEYYTENGITEAEAETLLRNYLANTENTINRRFIDKYGLTLTQGQFDALVSFTYNCGSSWISETTGTFHNAIKNGETGSELIRAFSLWCSAGGQILPGLVRRRLSEANMYLNEQYSRSKPDNFCYVYYDANGGTVSYRIQGYDSNLSTAPAYTPTNGEYVFAGWYTSKVGGTKVTTLTQGLSGNTLYARWMEAGDVPEEETGNETPDDGVLVTVTGDYVNLRKGPGTNYGIVGTAKAGDTMTITETATGTGYLWGNAGGKWICLQFTNYDEVMNPQNPTEPETTEPETTEPETTEPETTEPETTEPETTEPETTEPAPTEPETTEPTPTEPETTEPTAPPVSGTVDANGGLAVRTGAGTGYGRIRYLPNGSKVVILEQKKVGSMTWGRISDGWISMHYVVLDSEVTEPAPTEPAPTEPAPIEPAPTEPAPTEPAPTEPAPTEPAPTEPATPAAVTGKVKANGGLSVRNGPGTSYSVRRYLPDGSSVTITEQQNVNGMYWGKISDGWISMNYVVMDNQAPSTEETVVKTVNTGCLRIRSAASTSASIVDYVYRGDRLTIFEMVSVDGISWGRSYTGWVCMDYMI